MEIKPMGETLLLRDELNFCLYSRGGLNQGWGHVRRSATFACDLKATIPEANITFVAIGDEHVENNLNRAHHNVLTLPQNASLSDEITLLQSIKPDILVLDDIHFNEKQFEAYKSTARMLVAFNDLGHDYPLADISVLPQYVEHTPTARKGQTLLSGPQYFILAPGIRKLCGAKRSTPPIARHLLAFFGGAVRKELLLTLLPCLEHAKTSFDAITFLLGFDHDVPDSLLQRCRESHIELVEGTEDISPYLERADMALASSGYVKYELAAAGVPAVLTSIVTHQELLGKVFARRSGAARFAGDIFHIPHEDLASQLVALANDHKVRKEMTAAGKRILDGQGGNRIAATIQRKHLDIESPDQSASCR